MKSLASIGTYVLNKCWTAAALLLVAVAVLISLLRYSLPYMDSQKHYLEDWIAEQYGADLSIGFISATWKGVGPAIVLRDLQLKNGDTSPVGLSIDETQIEIDFWASVANQQLISRQFNLVGMDLRLDLGSLQGGGDDTPLVEAMEALFLERLQRFSVLESRLHLVKQHDQQVIELQQLEWHNDNDVHLAKGQLRVEELAQNSASFLLDLRGDDDDLTGTFYAAAEDLDFSPWLQEVLHSSQELVASRASMEFWASIENKRFGPMQLEINPSEVVWQDDRDRRHQALLEGGRFQAHPSLDGWHFTLDDLQIRVDDQPSHVTSWQGKKDYLGHYHLNLTTESNLRPLIPLLSMATDSQGFSVIESMSPSARVTEFEAVTSSVGPQLKASFDALSTREYGQAPGIEQLSGQIIWSGNQGKINLDGSNGALMSQALLGHPLAYNKLNLLAYLVADEGGIQVHGDNFSIQGESLNTRHQFRFHSAESFLSWAGEIDGMEMAKVKALLPVSLMGRGTKAWLDRGLVDGRLASANVIWHGPLGAYPYADNQGIFQAAVNLQETELLFARQWPTLTDLDLELLFENKALHMRSSKANLLDAELKSLYGVFPELSGSATLSIDAKISAHGAEIANVMQQSALKSSVGAALNQVQINGEVDGQLHLEIPLKDNQVIAKGHVDLHQVPLHITSLDLTLDETVGVIAFENANISIESLQSKLFGQPTTLTAKGWQQEGGYQTRIGLEGGWQVEQLLQDYHPGLSPFLSGAANWQGQVDLEFPGNGYSFDVRLKSDLAGMQSSLPAPYAKVANAQMPLTIDAEGNSDATSIRILLGDEVRFNGLYPHAQKRITRAHLSMGDDDFVGMGQGFTITANLEQLPIEPWYQAVSALLNKTSSGGILPAPKRIVVSSDKVLVAGQTLTDVQFNVRQTDQSWQVEVAGEQLRADMDFFHDWANKGIAINADYFSLDEIASVESKGDFNPQHLPPIQVRCADCKVNNIDLGKLQAELQPSQDGMKIEQLMIEMPHGRIDAVGNWLASNQQQQTQLKGRFQSDDLGVFLKGLQVESGVRDSDANFSFDLAWQKAPYGFEVATLGGDIDWRLGDGYLAEVDDKGARLLSVLSLRSLMRKLRLDFRDVFAKGFFYDDMRGTFQLENGVVSTEDTRINGAAAEIQLAGKTNLNNRQLAYDIDITPKVTSSVPVIVAWMVNPATALAALALDEVITSAKVISDIEYKLTGTLDQPVLAEVGRSSKDIALPAQNRPLPSPDDPLTEPTIPANKGY